MYHDYAAATLEFTRKKIVKTWMGVWFSQCFHICETKKVRTLSGPLSKPVTLCLGIKKKKGRWCLRTNSQGCPLSMLTHTHKRHIRTHTFTYTIHSRTHTHSHTRIHTLTHVCTDTHKTKRKENSNKKSLSKPAFPTVILMSYFLNF